ncbi:MAG: thiamine pyrophosphate-binding protein [Eubacteriales bacterium]|nr:thiamine pyrophosphate-binding protein [Eubacteriales bacterium]
MYSNEENILQLIALLKAHGIRKIIASPGNTNITFIGSIQNDPYFEIYSCVDERSAAYIACGMAEESSEPVALSCTGATAARNYVPGLTEAFYRKLPVLAITASQPFGRVGQLFPQFTDRNIQLNDIVTKSVQIPYPYSDEERWSNNVKINSALLQLTKDGGGPVHINIATTFSHDFSVQKLPNERVINRYTLKSEMPSVAGNKICIFVGSHRKFTSELEKVVDEFCEKYNAIVLCDQTSNYKGKYRVLGGLVANQSDYYPNCRKADLIIHLGEITGSYYYFRNTPVWRVSIDGEVRDPFKALVGVFQMDEIDFFKYYNKRKESVQKNTYLIEWREEERHLQNQLAELPLSNAWLCQQTAPKLPQNAVLHLGILNSLRSWNLFDTNRAVYSYSNVGGFGIDGVISSCVGAALADPNKLFFCVLGDLATFYDMNVLGNRHIGPNLRIIVSNNGTGYEMHCSGSIGKEFGEAADDYMAAGGHFGNKSHNALCNFAKDMGFEYLKAETKEEYLNHLEYFVSEKTYQKPIIFEVFIEETDDDIAYNMTKNMVSSAYGTTKKVVKNVLGEKGYSGLKKVLKRL